jgi:flagellar hook assembly protein FlgD
MRRAGILGTAALVAATSLSTWGSATSRADAAAWNGLLTLHDWGMVVSPNGDGVHDTGQITFDLARRAHVWVTVVSGHLAVTHDDLGQLGPGRHPWSWGGRRDDGTRAPDGYYSLVVRSSTGRKPDQDLGMAKVDTTNTGQIAYGRWTVYPRARVVHDAVQITFVETGWVPSYGDLGQERTVLRVLDPRGRLVHRAAVRRAYTPTFVWDGRRDDGKVADDGRYEARVTTVDYAGNRWEQDVTLNVSSKQLRMKVSTWTLAAADETSYVPDYDGCNGCGVICDPVSSDRFPGGLSFRPCTSPYIFWAGADDVDTSPEAPAPVDSYRVTVTGGPTTPGTADTGYLYVAGRTTTTTPVGDGSATSPWARVRLAEHPFLPNGSHPVHWTFRTDKPSSYDVATFTVDYRYYVPVA